MLHACCLLVCLVAASQQYLITDFAVPSAVKIGENAELQCRYEVGVNESDQGPNFYVKWWRSPLNAPGDAPVLLYQRMPGRPLSQHGNGSITIKANDTIELLDLQPKDSGTYECEVSNVVNEARQHHELIVYTEGSGPLLNLSTVRDGADADSEDDVVVTCEAVDVAPEPDLVITVAGHAISPDIEVVYNGTTGEYSIYAKATLNDTLQGAEVRCELFYKNRNVQHPVYSVSVTYEGSGAELASTGEPENTTNWDRWETTTPKPTTDGATSLSSFGASLLLIAVLTLHLQVLH